MNISSHAQIELKGDTLFCQGNWTAIGISALGPDPLARMTPLHQPLKIDGKAILNLDTAGAWLLNQLSALLKSQGITTEFIEFKSPQLQLINLVASHAKSMRVEKKIIVKEPYQVRVGKSTVERALQIYSWFSLVGEFFILFGKACKRLHSIRFPSICKIIEVDGYHALPIIGFLSFLIGVVLTYQIGLELKYYGANVYIVNFLGSGVLREFGPLLTAIIVAGRTGAAFTAQIGTMKVNEEIDALRTMGLSPVELLVSPRMIGLIIAMPLLVLWADIFGIMGGMMMSKMILDVNYYNFLLLFPHNVTLTSFLIGMCKAPVFALIIASVGCYEGLRVARNAESVGIQTTKSVVLSILLIIIADAGFCVLLNWLKL